jgi:ferritin-like metal-binding protein YciE
MEIFTKDIKTMDDLLLHGLQDIYYAEQQITKALPKMIDKATNRDLATGFRTHLEETNKQIDREALGHDDIVRFLTTNLNEEKAANTKLNTIATRKGVNAKACDAA